jgi:hypothetical protein
MADEITFQNDPVDYEVWKDVPENEYADERACTFELEFVSPRCARVRLAIRPAGLGDGGSIMLDGYEPGDPWAIELRDAAGSLTYESADEVLAVASGCAGNAFRVTCFTWTRAGQT